MLYKSTDGGAVWIAQKEIYGQEACALVLCQDVPGVILFGGKSSYARILRSTDNGATWSNVLTPDNLYTNDIEVDPFNPFHLLECSYSSSPSNTYLYESFDHGENWDNSSYPTLAGKGYDILFSTSVPGRFLCATSQGIYLSDDGETFDRVLDLETLMLEEKSDRPGEMFAACAQNGVYRSFDSGLTWTPMDDLYLEPVNVACVEIVGDSWLYAGTQFFGSFRHPLIPSLIENFDDSEISLPSVAVLASPVFASVTVMVNPDASGATLNVFDISGRAVYSEHIPESEAVQNVGITRLTPGVYFTGIKNQTPLCRFVVLGSH